MSGNIKLTQTLKLLLFLIFAGGFFLFAHSASAATLYWYGGSGNWSSATGHWSTNSGNSPAADHIAPVAADTVVTDALSDGGAGAYTITIDGAAVAAGATFAPPSSGNLTITTSAIKTASLTLSGNVTITGTPNIGSNSSTNRLLIKSNITGTIRYIVDAAATPTFSNVDLQDVSPLPVTAASRKIVAIGNSLIANAIFTTTLQDLVVAHSGGEWSTVNAGVGGNTSSMILARFVTDALNVPGVEYVAIDGGGAAEVSTPESRALLRSNLQSMYTQAHNAGLKVISISLFPNDTSYTGDILTQVLAQNYWQQHTATDVDYYIDMLTPLSDPNNFPAYLPIYNSGDGTHPSSAGAVVFGQTVYDGVPWVAKANLWDLSAITGLSGDCGGNDRVTFTPAATQYYYKASSYGYASTPGNWFLGSGGSGGAGRVPLPQDSVIVDRNSFGANNQEIRQDMARTPGWDWSDVANSIYTGYKWTFYNYFSIFGTVTLTPGMVLDASGGAITFKGRSPMSVTSAGKTFNGHIALDTTSSLTQVDALLSTGNFYFNGGVWNTGNNAFTAASIIWTGTPIALVYNLGVSSVSLSGTGTVWQIAATAVINAGTSTIKLTDTSATAKTITLGNGSPVLYNLWFAGGAGGGSYAITGGPTLTGYLKDDGTAAHSIKFTKSTNTTIADWEVGTASSRDANTNVITLDTVDGAGTFTLTKTGTGYASSDYLSINRSAATPASTWYAGLNSTNGGTNTGWTFTPPPPLSPTIGTPSAQSSTSIRWPFTDNASDETGFRIYDNLGNIATSSATTNLTYLDEPGLSPNIQYTGRYVTAYNTYGNSASSSIASSIYTLASTPTNLSASSDANSITLSVDALNNPTSGLSGYYFSRPGANSGWITTNSWTDSGLTCGTSYAYSVIYKNGDGTTTSPISLTQSTNPCPGGGLPPGWLGTNLSSQTAKQSNPPEISTHPSPSQYGLKEGMTVSSADDPDIYIINDSGYKRLFLNPIIFSFYGHLGGFRYVTKVSSTTRDAFETSGLFRDCESNNPKVYALETTGEDTGILHHLDISGTQAVQQDPDFFKKVFCINNKEFNWYTKNGKEFGTPFSSANQVPKYQR